MSESQNGKKRGVKKTKSRSKCVKCGAFVKNGERFCARDKNDMDSPLVVEGEIQTSRDDIVESEFCFVLSYLQHK